MRKWWENEHTLTLRFASLHRLRDGLLLEIELCENILYNAKLQNVSLQWIIHIFQWRNREEGLAKYFIVYPILYSNTAYFFNYKT